MNVTINEMRLNKLFKQKYDHVDVRSIITVNYIDFINNETYEMHLSEIIQNYFRNT